RHRSRAQFLSRLPVVRLVSDRHEHARTHGRASSGSAKAPLRARSALDPTSAAAGCECRGAVVTSRRALLKSGALLLAATASARLPAQLQKMRESRTILNEGFNWLDRTAGRRML